MAIDRRKLKGIKGEYEFAAPLRADDLSQHSLAINRSAQGDARFVIIRESLPEVMQSKALLAEFLKDLRVVSRFRHANLERTIETGRTKTSYFCVTEFLLGDGLGRILNEARRLGKRLPPALAAGLVAEVAEGLAHAHQVKDSRGKPLDALHHHVHPNSIVLLYHGGIKLTDFDIRRQAFRIEAGVPKGEVAYSSPERSLHQDLGPQTDVFSLGVVLWELLAERRLFYRRSQVDTLRAIQTGDLPAIEKAEPVPEALVAVARRALECDPGKRWAGGKEMAAALEAALDELGESVGDIELSTFIRSVVGDREKLKRKLLTDSLERDLDAGELGRLMVDQRSQVIWLPQPGDPTAGRKPDPAAEPAPEAEPTPEAESAPEAKPAPEVLPRTEMIDRPAGAGSPLPAEDEQPDTQASIEPVKKPDQAEDPVAAGRAQPAEPPDVPTLPPKPPITSPDLNAAGAKKDPTPAPAGGTAADGDDEIEYIEEELQPAPPEFQPSKPPPPDDETERSAAALLGAPEQSDVAEVPSGPSIRISMPKKAGAGPKSRLPLALGLGGVIATAVVLAIAFWPGGATDPSPADAGLTAPVTPDAGPAPEQATDAGQAAGQPDKPDPPAGREPIEATSLEVRSTPTGCPVWLDGKRMDEPTPLTGVELVPNRGHLVVVKCPGHALAKKRFSPKPGEQVALDLTPPRITQGHLDLNSIPWTEVYRGRRKLGITPLLNVKLPAGKHRLRMVNKQAGIDETITVTIQPGKKTSLLKKLGN